MSELLQFIMAIVDVINTLLRFIMNSITSLISLIVSIPTYLSFIINSINILPKFLIPYMVAFVSIVVVQYILNRKAS